LRKSKFLFLSFLFFCKISFAQKINLPDSLPFTLEYIDSITFVNAKSLNAELVRDTSNFIKRKDSLFVIDDNKKIVAVFVDDNFLGNPKFDSTKPQVETEIGKLYNPIGYYKVNNNKWFLINVNQWESGFNILISENTKNQISIDDIALNKHNLKFISTFYTPVGIPQSYFSISAMDNSKTEYFYQFDCNDKFAFEECNECVCLWIQDRKWVSDKVIFLQSVRFTTNKKYYFKLTLKK